MPEYNPPIPTTPAPSPSLINRAAVKRLALLIAQETYGAGNITRVSAKFIDDVNERVGFSIRDYISENRVTGKTL